MTGPVGLAAILALSATVARSAPDDDQTAPRPPFEGRLSYAPLPLTAGGDPREIAAAAAQVAQAATGARSPETLRAAAALKLQQGRAGEAVELYEQALQLAVPTADVLSDLAAGRLTEHRQTGSPLEALLALDAAARSIALDGAQPAARFNHARALETVRLTLRAEQAWASYLEVDAASPWAEVARRASPPLRPPDVLADPIGAAAITKRDLAALRTWVDGEPHAARTMALTALLPRWAALAREGRTDEEALLREALATVAQALERRTGDAQIADIVNGLSDAHGHPSLTGSLASGLLLFQEGGGRYARRDADHALDLFRRAHAALTAAGSPLSLTAEFYAACCRYLRGELGPAAADFESLLARIGARRYVHLKGQVLRLLALSYAVGGRPAQARVAAQTAQDLLTATGDVDAAAAAASTAATLLDDAEDFAGAVARLLDTLKALDARRGNRREVLAVLARRAHGRGYRWAALEVQNELLLSLRGPREEPAAVVDGLLVRSRIRRSLGQDDPADADLAEAERLVPSIASDALRRRYTVEQLAARARPRDDASRRIASLEPAYAELRKVGHRSLQAQLAAPLGLAYRDAGQASRSVAVLRETVDDLRPFPAATPSERVEALEIVQETLVDVLAAQGRLDEAFELWDESRSDERPGASSDDGTLAAVRRVLGLGDVLIEFVVTPERLHVFVVRRASRLSVISVPVKSTDLQDLVRRVRQGLEGDRPEAHWAEAVTRLRELLLGSVDLRDSDRLLVVPHRFLFEVPFAALKTAVTGRFLVEDHAIVVAPSARFLSLPAGGTGASATAVVVANPAHPPHDLGLTALPAAETEGRAVASLYARSVLLSGEAATVPALRAALMHARILHFAGHAVPNGKDPDDAALVLAGDRDPSAAFVYARNITPELVAGLQLAVLSSCRGGAGRITRGGGAASLARAFHRAGVPTVVASLWAIEDGRAPELMAEFHRRHRSGEDAGASLRGAQIHLLHHPDRWLRSPSAWGGYVVSSPVAALLEVPAAASRISQSQ